MSDNPETFLWTIRKIVRKIIRKIVNNNIFPNSVSQPSNFFKLDKKSHSRQDLSLNVVLNCSLDPNFPTSLNPARYKWTIKVAYIKYLVITTSKRLRHQYDLYHEHCFSIMTPCSHNEKKGSLIYQEAYIV